MRKRGSSLHHAMHARLLGPVHRRLGRSIFAKLVAVMLAMTASLLALVAGFFLLYVSPALNASVDRVLEEYARSVAATAPAYRAAKQISDRLDVRIRYEGPNGAWTTGPDVPGIVDAQQARHEFFAGRHSYVVPAKDGGTFVFTWTMTAQARRAHLLLLVVLLLLIAAVVFVAHAVLKHLLEPLRALDEGVSRLGEGQLDVVVRKRTIDEFGALTDAFNQMVGRVRAMIHARDQLLLDVSHELRSPVTRLKVAVELVADPEMKARMAADLAEMEIMIGELVELERLRSRDGIRPTRQNIVPLLTEVTRRFEGRPPGVHIASAAPEILADVDADRLQMAVRNVLENGVKYSLPDSRPVTVSAAAADRQLVITVTDDGPGIPERDLPNVFEPFFRVDRSRSKKTGGYGLGLSIAKRIVEAHGGRITVANQPTRGASFVIAIPIAQVVARQQTTDHLQPSVLDVPAGSVRPMRRA